MHHRMVPGLCLFDLDGTLREGRTITHLATRFDVQDRVDAVLLAGPGPHAGREESERVMACFAGVPAAEFAAACAELPCRPGARELVDGLHERGFRVGVVTASYEPAALAAVAATGAELMAALEPEVKNDKLTGRLHPGPWEGRCGRLVCKHEVLQAWRDREDADFTVAVGNAGNDVCMFEAADMSVAVRPSTDSALAAADDSVVQLLDILPLVDAALTRHRSDPSWGNPAEPPRH